MNDNSARSHVCHIVIYFAHNNKSICWNIFFDGSLSRHKTIDTKRRIFNCQ